VSLGTRQDRIVEVTAGLSGDEVLASSNLSQLATGVAVRMGGEGPEDRPAGRIPEGKKQEGG
jgi:hypothetical protein